MQQPDFLNLPCRLERDRHGRETIIDADGGVIFSDASGDTIEGVAEWIVRCLNGYPALFDMLRLVVERIEDNAEAFALNPNERGWRATFTYGETVRLRELVDPVYADAMARYRKAAEQE